MKKTALLVLFAALLAPVSMFADGKASFEAKCKMCHGAKLEKKAIDNTKSEAELLKHLTTDAKHKSRVADEAMAKEIVAYIKTIKK